MTGYRKGKHRIKNKILIGITHVNIGGMLVAICFADSGSYVPYICIAINAAWLGLYTLANKGNFKAWEL